MQITPDFIRDPYPTYRRMRESDAAHRSEANEGALWFVPGYAEVCEALRDERFSAALKASWFLNQLAPEERAEFERFDSLIRMWIVVHDPPEHTRLRRLLNQGFTPRLLEHLRPRVQLIADRLLDDVQARGNMDFVAAFAQPFPVKVIAEALAVDPEHYRDFVEWSDDIVMLAGSLRPTAELFRRAQSSLTAMIEYFRRLLPERRRNMGNDLISLLIRVEEQGDVLSPAQLLSSCAQLIFAGHEASRNLLANGLHSLLSHPDQLARLRAEPQLMKSAVREMLRFESPLQFVRRVAREDVNFHGKRIREGESALLMLGSANRDESRFSNADVFDVTRNPSNHVAFGYGAHACIGAAFAHLEAELAFSTILTRFPNLALAAEPERVPNPMLRGFKSLPLVF